MIVNFHKVNLKKKHPLQISRGVHDKSQNLFLEIIKDGITAWGESAPGKTEGASTADEVEKWLLKLIDTDIDSLSIYEIYQRSKELNIPPCAYAAIDIALWDWKAKKAGLPLRSLLGLPSPSTPTSLIIGINPPEIIKERVEMLIACLLYTSPSPRDRQKSRMPSSA